MINITIQKDVLPESSLINNMNQRYDYIDSYSSVIQLHKQTTLTIEDIGRSFFSSPPAWVDNLLTLRNSIVKIFGIKVPESTRNKQALIESFECKIGDQLGLFKVMEKNANEIVFGEDNKHLDFRVSLFIDRIDKERNGKLIISTIVLFNNWLGRLYFLPVKQFHILIVPTILKGMVRQLKIEAEP